MNTNEPGGSPQLHIHAGDKLLKQTGAYLKTAIKNVVKQKKKKTWKTEGELCS